jgi:diguanylate cyclase (GGDEF)-like protein
MSDDLQNEVTQLRQQKARLEQDVARLLTLDQLTGLLNRSAFMHHVDGHFKATKQPPQLSAMIEFGLTGLPRISGTLGRHVGDYLVAALAARLHASAETNTLCCRLDYRSFAIFLPAVTDPLEAMTLAKKYLQILSEPVDWVDRRITIAVGAGVALSNANDRDATVLLQNAGLAYKSATDRGSPGYAFFNPALSQAAKRRSDVITALQEALDKQYFSLNYQPFFAGQTGELSGFEALLRLTHPEFGNISPVEFIPIAEEIGIISKLGAWALAEACQTAADWPSHLTVAVNVSPEQFKDGSLMTDVHNALELASFPAYRLELEVTESTMMAEAEIVLSQLQSLRELGCAIVLDDFGTGYSSLSYLWKFPFSKLKIDRSFVQAMEEKPRVRGMLTSIMSLSRNLGLVVTAEGVETDAQAQMIQDIHCEYIQGYLTGKPMAASDIPAMIMRRFTSKLKARLAPQPIPTAPSLKYGTE